MLVGLGIDARLVSPFSKRGQTYMYAALQFWDTLPVSRGIWYMIQGFRLSGPAALRGFSSLNTPFRETVIFGIWRTELGVSLSIWDG